MKDETVMFWSTSYHLQCKLTIVLNLLKCHIIEHRLSLTSQCTVTISIPPPAPFFPLNVFLFLQSSCHQVAF